MFKRCGLQNSVAYQAVCSRAVMIVGTTRSSEPKLHLRPNITKPGIFVVQQPPPRDLSPPDHDQIFFFTADARSTSTGRPISQTDLQDCQNRRMHIAFATGINEHRLLCTHKSNELMAPRKSYATCHSRLRTQLGFQWTIGAADDETIRARLLAAALPADVLNAWAPPRTTIVD